MRYSARSSQHCRLCVLGMLELVSMHAHAMLLNA
jgi:hypothetical protein